MIIYGINSSPFGKILIATQNSRLTDLRFIDDKDIAEKYLFKRWKNNDFIRNDHKLQYLTDRIFLKKAGPFDLDIYLTGTSLQIRVWQALMTIQEGTVCTYSDIAKKVHRPDAVRAIAGAIGKNPIHYVIPCHRVIRKDGSLGGYAAGVMLKKTLLAQADFSA